MVCEACEKKLSLVIVPDKWKEGARNTTESGGRKLSGNKLLTARRTQQQAQPYSKRRCKNCKGAMSQERYVYCQTCSYKLGICAMCGKKILDTSSYRQSSK